MILAREAKRTDPLGRYYTDSRIGDYLVQAMNISSPVNVIDLGAGSGTLVRSASKAWPGSTFFTVDIDRKKNGVEFSNIQGVNVHHHTADALDHSLADKLGLGWEQVDAAICNPPYLLPKWKKHFEEILVEAGLRQYVPKTGDISADLLFIAQNLRMLKSGGKLGLIIPDGIIAGEKYAPLRQALVSKHCVERVIELPTRAFKNTDAKAHILILEKGRSSNEFIHVSKINVDGQFSDGILVPTENFSNRLDYSYLVGKSNYRGQKRISDVIEKTFRGSVSSIQRRNYNFPIFHTTDFKASTVFVPKKFYLSKRKMKDFSGKVAIQGDILISRVGRNLSKKISMVARQGSVPISDCVLALTVKENIRDEVFKFLCSEGGRQYIETGTKGVGARFITPKSLGEIRF